MALQNFLVAVTSKKWHAMTDTLTTLYFHFTLILLSLLLHSNISNVCVYNYEMLDLLEMLIFLLN
jgi:hypothetical protein